MKLVFELFENQIIFSVIFVQISELKLRTFWSTDESIDIIAEVIHNIPLGDDVVSLPGVLNPCHIPKTLGAHIVCESLDIQKVYIFIAFTLKSK